MAKKEKKVVDKPWVCDECKENPKDAPAQCVRPEYCNAAREKRLEAADLARKEQQEKGIR